MTAEAASTSSIQQDLCSFSNLKDAYSSGNLVQPLLGFNIGTILTYFLETRADFKAIRENAEECIPQKATLQSVLTEKYNIEEKLLVEGVFIRMYQAYGKAQDLVSLGISNDNFVMARVVITGHAVDYELISITPLCRLYLDVINSDTKEIMVTSKFKSPQFFQMCTSMTSNVWNKFAKLIQLSKMERKKTWMDVELHSIETAGGDYFAPKFYASCASDSAFQTTFDNRISLMRSEYQGKFDHFVNDAASQYCDTNRNCNACLWTCALDEKIKSHDNELKKPKSCDGVNSAITHEPAHAKKGWRNMWPFRKILGTKKLSAT